MSSMDLEKFSEAILSFNSASIKISKHKNYLVNVERSEVVPRKEFTRQNWGRSGSIHMENVTAAEMSFPYPSYQSKSAHIKIKHAGLMQSLNISF